MTTLAELQANYLAVRQHTISESELEQSDYIVGEARELDEAVQEWVSSGCDFEGESIEHVYHELADVVLAATTLAGMLGVTVEHCIALKTEADRGRG